MKRFAWIPLTVFSAIALIGGCCKPKVGGSCSKDGDIQCEGTEGSKALLCRDKKWVEYNCRGANGCKKDGKNITCDNSIGEVGDVCTGSGFACSVDSTAGLECKNGTMVKSSDCLGPDKCKVDKLAAKPIQCDMSVSNPGTPCSTEGGAACTPDHKAMLTCTGGVQQVKARCEGAKGCYINKQGTTNMVYCDPGVATPGAACTQNGYVSCTADKKVALRCNGANYQPLTACRGPRGCDAAGGQLKDCDKSQAYLGDPCNDGEEGKYTCSSDVKAILRCDGGKWTQVRYCFGVNRCGKRVNARGENLIDCVR